MHRPVLRPPRDQGLPPAINVIALATFTASLSVRALDPLRRMSPSNSA
jgi:MFS transporter, DHA1 family, inner membrane transport protein